MSNTKTPYCVDLGGSLGVGETPLGAMVACMLDLENVEEHRQLINQSAALWDLSPTDVWKEYQRAAQDLGKSDDCPHDELEFDGNCEVQRDTLVFHVNCRKCGRSGSTTVTAEEVLW